MSPPTKNNHHHHHHHAQTKTRNTNIRRQIRLLLLSRSLLLSLRRSSSLLLLLLGVLLALLLALLQLGLGDLLASNLVEQKVGHGSLSLLDFIVRHICIIRELVSGGMGEGRMERKEKEEKSIGGGSFGGNGRLDFGPESEIRGCHWSAGFWGSTAAQREERCLGWWLYGFTGVAILLFRAILVLSAF